MTEQQAHAILRGCSARIDFTTAKVLDHVILEGWFDLVEIEAVLAVLHAQTQPAKRSPAL